MNSNNLFQASAKLSVIVRCKENYYVLNNIKQKKAINVFYKQMISSILKKIVKQK